MQFCKWSRSPSRDAGHDRGAMSGICTCGPCRVTWRSLAHALTTQLRCASANAVPRRMREARSADGWKDCPGSGRLGRQLSGAVAQNYLEQRLNLPFREAASCALAEAVLGCDWWMHHLPVAAASSSAQAARFRRNPHILLLSGCCEVVFFLGSEPRLRKAELSQVPE